MIPTGMHAVRVNSAGDASVMQLEQRGVPLPAAGEVLIRVEWAGVNFIDVYKRSGAYRTPLPFTLGEEGAGTVVARGEGVNDIETGARVAWAQTPGSYSEYIVAPASRVVPVPDNVSTRDAAAVMLQGMTAHYLATSTFPLKQGSTCLVHASAGGVGLLLVQIARKLGAVVIGTAGSPAKLELARNAGANEVINYSTSDFVAETRRITNGRGVDVVYDSVGASTFLAGFDVLAPRGMMVLFGQSSGAVAPLDPQLLNHKGSLFLTRPSLGAYIANRDEMLHRANELFSWVGGGTLHVRIGAEFPLADVAEAHRALEGRRTTGKVLLKVAPD